MSMDIVLQTEKHTCRAQEETPHTEKEMFVISSAQTWAWTFLLAQWEANLPSRQ